MTRIDRKLLAASWRSWVASDLSCVGPYWLQWLWTLLFSAGMAAAFLLLSWLVFNPRAAWWGTLGGWAWQYARYGVVCVTIGVVIQVLFDATGAAIGGAPALRRWPRWRRSLFVVGMPLLGVAIGWPLGLVLAGVDVGGLLAEPSRHRFLAGGMALALLSTFGVQQLFAAQARRNEAERQATEAQLRLLQGQMEPHFLFNTLANVDALIDAAPQRARAMLAAFSELLRVSLAQLRRDECTLDDELALAEHYLRLMQFRMEERLQFTIEASAAARRVRLPPLLLQPLIENAIAHGLEPRLEGGAVHIAAAIDGAGRLTITVRDQGRGPAAAAAASSARGNGIALATLRERLQALDDPSAALELASAESGTMATLRLPLRPGDADARATAA